MDKGLCLLNNEGRILPSDWGLSLVLSESVGKEEGGCQVRRSLATFLIGCGLPWLISCRAMTGDEGALLPSLLHGIETTLELQVMSFDVRRNQQILTAPMGPALDQLARILQEAPADIVSVQGLDPAEHKTLRAYLPAYSFVIQEERDFRMLPRMLLYRHDRFEKDVAHNHDLPKSPAFDAWRLIERSSRKTFIVLEIAWHGTSLELPTAKLGEAFLEETLVLRKGKEPLVVLGSWYKRQHEKVFGDDWLDPHAALAPAQADPSSNFILCQRRRCEVLGAEVLQPRFLHDYAFDGHPYLAHLRLRGAKSRAPWRLAAIDLRP
jgi:hypothetical protein